MVAAMAKCTFCNLEMRGAGGCAVSAIILDGVTFDRIPHGSSKIWGTAQTRCSDCGVDPVSIHHAGCQYEQCPKCEDPQMFACGCQKTA